MISYEAKMHDPDRVEASNNGSTFWLAFEKDNYELVAFVDKEQAIKLRDDLNSILA